jgi:ribose/xylose/arabinose/galactoside ABC-type transport system permease subunit
MNATVPERRQGLVEQVITGLVNGIVVPVTSVIPFLVTSGIMFVVFAALWVAFGAGLVLNQGGVDQAWEWIRSLPLIAQAVVWLLFLPVAAGLWIWESSWPLVVRLVLVAGLAGWNLLVFIPRSTPS